jgi:hypothetical protein
LISSIAPLQDLDEPQFHWLAQLFIIGKPVDKSTMPAVSQSKAQPQTKKPASLSVSGQNPILGGYWRRQGESYIFPAIPSALHY